MMRPPYGRRHKTPFDRQVLGVAVRRAETNQEPILLKLTEPRIKLMQAVAAGDVKAGQGSYVGEWRWAGLTVTARMIQIMRAGWAEAVGKHAELTDAGREVLAGVP